MPMKGDSIRYGSFAVALHWLSAGLIFLVLPLGFATALMSLAAPTLSAAIGAFRVHAVLGLLIFLLTLARLFWRPFDLVPTKPSTQPRWQWIVAKATHWLLYGLLVTVASAGICTILLSNALPILLMQSSGPLPHFFQVWPATVHSLAAFSLIGLIILHVGAALYHHYYKRDGLLLRMRTGVSQPPPFH